MQKNLLIILLSCLFLDVCCHAQTQKKLTTEEYIALYKDAAVQDMQVHKIPASITLAQGILESGSGNSTLATKANNHFGIKCHSDWTGETMHMDDDAKNECFRSYKKVGDSYSDHSLFLLKYKRYAFLFELDINDYKAWAKGLKEAGYATNPKYPELLINLIEKYNLNQYDSKDYKPSKSDKKAESSQNKGDKAQPEFPKNNIEGTYGIPLNSNHSIQGESASGRTIMINNGVPLIYANADETPFSIAEEFHIYARQIANYNLVDMNHHFKKGDVVYLEPKKNKSKDYKYHTIIDGQNLNDVSQIYGIKLKKLCKINKCEPNVRIEAGTNIKLN